MSDGAEPLHYLLERDPGSPAFGHDLAATLPFSGRNPLYAVHPRGLLRRRPGHRLVRRAGHARRLPRATPTLLTGEHVFPWTSTTTPSCAPLREAADLLAEREWPRLYDADVLAAVDVPCAAAIYADDPFVDRAFSEETADLLPTMRTWVTDEYEHNGLGATATGSSTG